MLKVSENRQVKDCYKYQRKILSHQRVSVLFKQGSEMGVMSLKNST